MALWLKRLFCRHEFRGVDLQSRDAKGDVSWACRKCGKNYEAECGLDMQNWGTLMGPWTKEA